MKTSSKRYAAGWNDTLLFLNMKYFPSVPISNILHRTNKNWFMASWRWVKHKNQTNQTADFQRKRGNAREKKDNRYAETWLPANGVKLAGSGGRFAMGTRHWNMKSEMSMHLYSVRHIGYHAFRSIKRRPWIRHCLILLIGTRSTWNYWKSENGLHMKWIMEIFRRPYFKTFSLVSLLAAFCQSFWTPQAWDCAHSAVL
jgi:hypothetical protein